MNDPDKTVRKRFGCLTQIVAFTLFAIVVVAAFLFFNNRPYVARPGSPVVPPSVEFTGIASPLDSNGDVDYLEALNIRHSNGVTPENNALVPIAQFTRPKSEPEILGEIYERLGIDPPSPMKSHFLSYQEWRKTHSENAETLPDFYLELQFATTHLWNAEELPHVAKWLSEIDEPVAEIQKGLERTMYYQPLVSPGPPELLNAQLIYTQMNDEISLALAARARMKPIQSDFSNRLNNLRSLYRLAHHTGKSPTLVDAIFSLNLSRLGDELALDICVESTLTDADLQRLEEVISQHKIGANLAVRIDTGERYMGLDALKSLARSDLEGNQIFAGSPLNLYRSANFETAFKKLNSWYDSLRDAVAIEDDVERIAALAEFEEELRSIEEQMGAALPLFTAFFASKTKKGARLGDLFAMQIIPASSQVERVQLRSRAQRRSLRILIALLRFKNSNKEFPETLKQLTPEFIDSLPLDPLTGKDFNYQKTEAGFTLESTDENLDQEEMDIINVLWGGAQKQMSWSEFQEEN
jgi:hypothetical protein